MIEYFVVIIRSDVGWKTHWVENNVNILYFYDILSVLNVIHTFENIFILLNQLHLGWTRGRLIWLFQGQNWSLEIKETENWYLGSIFIYSKNFLQPVMNNLLEYCVSVLEYFLFLLLCPSSPLHLLKHLVTSYFADSDYSVFIGC